MRDSKHTVVKSSVLVFSLMLTIKIVAFLKQTVLASFFGASSDLDAFLLSADTIGDFANAAFSGLSVAIMTLYINAISQDKPEKARAIISQSFRFFTPIAVLLSVIFFVFSPSISSLLASQYDVEQQSVVSKYLKVISPTILSLCISYIGIAVLDGHKKFWPGRTINLVLSISIILATILFGGTLGTGVLPYAYTIAYFIYMLIIIFKLRENYHFRDKTSKDIFVKPILMAFLPIFLGNAATEINALTDKMLATSLGDGALSAQVYGSTLNIFIISILVTSLTTILLPYMSAHSARREFKRVSNLTYKALLSMLFFIVPISCITIINHKQIVEIVYMRGAFDENALQDTSLVLLGYTFSFAFVAIREILVKVQLSFMDNKQVMINGILSVLINILFSIILVNRFGIIGISLGTSVSAFFGMAISIITTKKHLKKFNSNSFLREFLKISTATIVATSIYLFSTLVINLDFSPLLQLCASSFLILVSYIIILYFSRSKTLQFILNKFAVLLLEKINLIKRKEKK